MPMPTPVGDAGVDAVKVTELRAPKDSSVGGLASHNLTDGGGRPSAGGFPVESRRFRRGPCLDAQRMPDLREATEREPDVTILVRHHLSPGDAPSNAAKKHLPGVQPGRRRLQPARHRRWLGGEDLLLR